MISITTKDAAHARDHKALPARMFTSHGSIEYPAFRQPIVAFQKQLGNRNYQSLALQTWTMEGLDHTAVKGDGYVRGLMWVWKPKKPVGPSGLTKAMQHQGE